MMAARGFALVALLLCGGASAERVDWRDKSVVPPVRNQGQTGASWVIAAVDVVEMVHAVATGELVELSDAEAEDCCGEQKPGQKSPISCLLQLGGLCKEADYPSPVGKCDKGKCNPAFALAGWTVEHIRPNVSTVKAAVRKAPVVAMVEADTPAFMEYMGGVLNTAKCGQRVDHVVSIVGFDDSASEPYWIVRNTWGASWGENGYVRVALDDSNVCGVMSEVSALTPAKGAVA